MKRFFATNQLLRALGFTLVAAILLGILGRLPGADAPSHDGKSITDGGRMIQVPDPQEQPPVKTRNARHLTLFAWLFALLVLIAIAVPCALWLIREYDDQPKQRSAPEARRTPHPIRKSPYHENNRLKNLPDFSVQGLRSPHITSF